MNNDALPRQRTSRLASNIHHRLLLIGLGPLSRRTCSTQSLLKVDLDEALANLSVPLFMVGGVQWTFDASIREELCQEIASLND